MSINRTNTKNAKRPLRLSGRSTAQKKHRKSKSTSNSDEEIESDDEAILEPSTDRNAEESKDKVIENADTALSAEERRLLLAQECLKRMGLTHGSVEVDEVAKSLIPDEKSVGKIKTRAVAASIKLGSPSIYHCANHVATCVDVDPVNREIAYTGGKDCRILRWDISTGQNTAFPGRRGDPDCEGHYAPINAIATGWNGRLLVSGGNDELLRIWDTRQAGKKFIAELRGHQKAITAIAISGDNIYTASDDKAVRVWSLVAQKCMETEYGHTSRVTCLDVGEGGMLLSGGQDSTCRYWNLENQKHSIFLESQAEGFDSVRLLNRYGFVAGDQQGRISLWSLAKRKPLQICKTERPNKAVGWVSALTGLNNSDCVISGADTGVIDIWEATMGDHGRLQHMQAVPLGGVINGMKFTCDEGSLLVAAAKEGRFGRWVLSKDRPVGLAVLPVHLSLS